MSRLALPAAAEAGRLVLRADATAAALGRTDVMTFSPLSPRLDTCIAYLPSAAGFAPSWACSFSRRTSIALGSSASAFAAPPLPSPFLSSPRLAAAFSSAPFSDDGCDELPRHSALLGAV